MSGKRYSIILDDKTASQVENLANKTGSSLAEVTRDLIKKGLAAEWMDENTDMVAHTVRQQMEAVLKPHVERLAALSSKTGHAAATAMFLAVQAFIDLVPPEKKRVPKDMYERGRKRAVEFMRTPITEWNDNNSI